MKSRKSQGYYYVDADGEEADTLKDKFWRNLEQGRINVFEGSDMYSKVKNTGRAARPKDFRNAAQQKVVEDEQDTSPQRKRRKSANSKIIKEKPQVKPPTKTTNKKQVTPPSNKKAQKGGKKGKNSASVNATAPQPKKKFQTKKPYVTAKPTTQRIRIIENEDSSTQSDEEEEERAAVTATGEESDSDAGHTESEVMKGDSETSYGSTVGEVMEEEVGNLLVSTIE